MAGGAAVLKRLLVSGRSLHWLKLSIKKKGEEKPRHHDPLQMLALLTNGYDERRVETGRLRAPPTYLSGSICADGHLRHNGNTNQELLLGKGL